MSWPRGRVHSGMQVAKEDFLHFFPSTFISTGADVMIFLIFSPKKSAKNSAFLTQSKAKLCKNLIITLVFEKNANFFRRNLAKIEENCDHNIDSWFMQ
jgi:hypothetical protein